MSEEAPQRVCHLREVCSGLPPLPVVYQPAQRWLKAEIFQAVERSFASATRYRRVTRDYGRLSEKLAGLHFVAFAMLFAARFVQLAIFLVSLVC